MHLIKLDQIDSTNDYLKQLNKEKFLENFTTIFTENQTKGKGQMGNVWISKKGKNLTFSTLYSLEINENLDSINLIMITAVSIIEVLIKNNLENLAIKWPNDIILQNKKIGGILIEQSKNYHNQTSFIIGIGLNVFKNDFKDLPNASSIEQITRKKLDLNFLLIEIISQLKQNISLKNNFKEKYLNYLYKLNLATTFLINDKKEIGKIVDVSTEGKLKIAFQDEIKYFGIKEIEMLY
jgi:BirA family transcriptional regulator, biotin operon repressor / biotin---[acetyl-CoA-carboxylase] ligase